MFNCFDWLFTKKKENEKSMNEITKIYRMIEKSINNLFGSSMNLSDEAKDVHESLVVRPEFGSF